jgi:hypothetical protein
MAVKSIPIGTVFGRWTIVGTINNLDSGRNKLWLCECTCGARKPVAGRHLRSGISKSCGCLSRELSGKRMVDLHLTHGETESQEYKVWSRMKTRCLDTKNKKYRIYGGRGITVCQEWLHSFERFLADMGRRPSSKHSLDRIDVDGNYQRSNCRWATAKQQANNTRRNLRISHAGKTLTLSEWADVSGIDYHALYYRIIISKWDITRAISSPVR